MRKNILITGASSGLGAEMARQFAAKGRNLVLTARRTDRLDELKASLTGVEVLTYALDVNDHDAVFRVFAEADEAVGGIDRVVVNAGLGKGVKIGKGRFDANRETAMTNFVGALAQCEAAMQLFYKRKSGHLVVVSSVSANRGFPSAMTVYAATKAGVAALAEGIRSDVVGRYEDIKVTTLYPGYIKSEMNERVQQQIRFMAETEDGVRAMVNAMEKEVGEATVPALPWVPLAFAMRHAPLKVVKKLM